MFERVILPKALQSGLNKADFSGHKMILNSSILQEGSRLMMSIRKTNTQKKNGQKNTHKKTKQKTNKQEQTFHRRGNTYG